MSFKGRTYSKKSSKAGNPFERMMKEQCNKPVAAKSAGIVGKWGATSFTSVRAGVNPDPSVPAAQPKVKKFFKSRSVKEDEILATVASAQIISVSSDTVAPPQQTSKKIFRSKNVQSERRQNYSRDQQDREHRETLSRIFLFKKTT